MAAKNEGASDGRQEVQSIWPSLLPAVDNAEDRNRGSANETTDEAEALVEALFSLEEPWRGRFLNLVANLATRWTWDGQPPTREELMAWLRADLDLYRGVRLLLDAWPRPRR